ncbi:MAG TPA: hypothetical protein VGQ83_25790 [Polyangia bacterium]
MTRVRGKFTGLAILSVIAGALLLCENFGLVGPVHRLWPVFPGFLGLGLAMLFVQRGKRDLVLLGIGSYLLGLSALFLVLNYTHWGLLARAWPVFLALLGLSSLVVAPFARWMRGAFWVSGGFLVLLAVAFYLIFGLNPRLWPACLVLFGLWILILTCARSRARTTYPR